MKILFVMRSTIYVRNFESTIRLLAERGHEVHIVAEPHWVLDPGNHAGRLAAEYPGIVHDHPPAGPLDGWALLSEELRRSAHYLRYLRPEYRNAPKLRRRSLSYAPPFILRATRHAFIRSATGLVVARHALRLADGALPINPVVFDFVREHNPDLLIVTPLVEPGLPESQYLRAARALGIRTVLCVHSWDNLTNKGLIQDPLDLVTVWNEPMKREAVGLHGVPRRRVEVTGAPNYDHWFEWAPRSTREEFCRRVGLPADRPYLLYLCSSKFIAPHEMPFVRRWIEALRSASAALAGTGVLIRPHPQWARPWRKVDFSDLKGVAIWPREGANPVDGDSRADYYDSIFHSAAVVGVNTSGQIESAIIGRGVYTLLAPEFRDTQEGTLHFQYLRSVNGGMLHVAETMDDHAAQLEAAVKNPGVDDGRCRRFVEAFVRPDGIDVAATPKLVAAIERVMAQPRRRPERAPWYAGLVRSRLGPLRAPLVREEARLLRKEQQRPQKLAQNEEKDARRMAELEERQRALEADPQLRQQVVAIYDDVRARVRQMKATAGVTTSLPEVEALWSATPEMLLRLRHFGACVGGAKWSDYADIPDIAKGEFRKHLRKLREEAGDQLLVREAPLLGQFGLLRGHGLFTADTLSYYFTADTLSYYEILAALKFGAVLGLRQAPEGRPVIWEVSRDWGGFAYQFKTLFPDVTYVVSSPPDLFLLSATYLRALFPAARVRFYGDVSGADLWRDLSHVDFVFLPDNMAHAVAPVHVTLALDLMGLERMTPDQADGHVRSVFEAGAPYFYSAMPTSTPPSAADVRAALARYYWLHELPVPQFDRRDALKPWSPQDTDDPRRIKRAHIMGWKRLCR